RDLGVDLVLDQAAETHRRRQRVRVRVVVRVDQRLLATRQPGQGTAEIERRARQGFWRFVHGGQGVGRISRLSKLTSASQSLKARYSCPGPSSGVGSVQVRKGWRSTRQSIVPPRRAI